jgi:hypothetical protein
MFSNTRNFVLASAQKHLLKIIDCLQNNKSYEENNIFAVFVYYVRILITACCLVILETNL